MLTQVEFERIDETIENANAGRTEPEAVAELCRFFACLPEGHEYLAQLDPFSPAYRAGILRVLSLITRRPTYEPERDEAANYLPDSAIDYLPSIYLSGDSAWLGELMQAWGSVLRALDLRRGARVLEYGAGEGFIAVQLARLGCDVTVVDIERRYLDIVRYEAESLRTSVTAFHGRFGEGPVGVTFDAILFFEAFHHALDHFNVLRSLRGRLTPTGCVVFAGEPIMTPGGYWSPTLPYPWGPRLDALSLRAMRTHGWCELGFSREYFVEAAMRAGFVVRFRPSADTERGSAYVARAHSGTIALGESILIEATGRASEWHVAEGGHRWTAAEEAVLPLDQTAGWTSVSIDVANWLPVAKHLSLRAGREWTNIVLPPGQTTEVTLPLRDTPPRLFIRCELTRLQQFGPAEDPRAFGIAVRRIIYR